MNPQRHRERAQGTVRNLGAAGCTRAAGAVLLEVVLALVLFVAAASVLSVAMSSSLDALERQKRQLHATNLAVSLFSELQMGLRPLSPAGPEPFKPPFSAWSWQLVVGSTEDEVGQGTGLVRAELVLRHDESATTYRSCQILGASHGTSLETSPNSLPGGSL